MQESTIAEKIENESSTKNLINEGSDGNMETSQFINLKHALDQVKFNAIDTNNLNHITEIVRFNAEDASEEIKCNDCVIEASSVERPSHEETSFNREAISRESSVLSWNDMDQLHRKFINEQVVSEGIWSKSSNEYEKYAENANDRKNRVDIISKADQDSVQHNLELHFEIGRSSNSNENFLEKHSMGRKMNIVELSKTETTRILLNNISSVYKEIIKFKMVSIRSSNEKIIASESSGSRDGCFEKEFTEEAREENYETTLYDEDSSKMAADGCRERLRPIQRVADTCPQKDGDYPDVQFGMCPEKGANPAEENSIMQSSMNAMQSREDEKEKRHDLGPFPVADSLKNDCNVQSTISLVQSATVSSGKEEEDLNAIIRRMIVTELKNHCRKAQATLKRAHSDTDKGSLRDKIAEKLDSGSIEIESDDATTRPEYSSNQDKDYLEDNINTDNVVTNVPNNTDTSANSPEPMCTMDSNILLERKINPPWLPIDPASEGLTRTEKGLQDSISMSCDPCMKQWMHKDTRFTFDNLNNGKCMACTYRVKFIEVSVGINHNVDDLLVGILNQIRLKYVQGNAENRAANGTEGSGHWYKSRGVVRVSMKARQMLTWLFGKEDSKFKNCENLHVL
ncbi:hypothetical protein WN55_02810 [Dufourea novaeangliae]|uniref:Uncharacterized protein n=1 Tax=Dufourea novaeangliae TaxID=178035 RepID=A0A154PJP3_DUFNO|nr:hypothetical protein WN55_02810 [Dufourea novaeangliae]